MKNISIQKQGKFDAVNVLKEIIAVVPRGMNLEQYRKRTRVLEKLTEAQTSEATELTLEDEDFNTLRDAINNCDSLTIVSPDILKILDAAVAPIKKQE